MGSRGTRDRDLNEALRLLVFAPLGIGNAFVATSREDMRSTPWGQEDYDPRWVYPVPRTLAAFMPDDHEDAQGILERHLHTIARTHRYP